MGIRGTGRRRLIGGVIGALASVGLHAGAASAGSPEGGEPTVAVEAVDSYAGFRVVRAAAGAPATPEITLPVGYRLVPGSQHQVASRAEYYSFVQGPRSAGITVSVRWPGQSIAAVVAGERRLPLRPDPADPQRVSFTLPVTSTSPTADSGTLQVFSHLSGSATGINWRVEHNDPDRAAGYWAGVAWPAGETRAVITYLVAADAVLRDSGLAAQARGRGHFFALMGFETNNLLHVDNPPHWHLSYYPGPTFSAARATVPHFWIDAQGRTFYNGMDVQGAGRTRYYAGDPAPIRDAEGAVVVTLTIRPDGGLDIDPPAGPRYSIVSADGTYTGALQVLRGGQLWRIVGSADDVRAGLLRTDVRGPEQDPFRETIEYRYDALTGTILGVSRL